MIALFIEGVGRFTEYFDAIECLQFPVDPTLHYWYESKDGTRYSFFEAMSKFYK